MIIKATISEVALVNQIFIKANNFENYPSFIKRVQICYELKNTPELLYINKEYAFFRIKDNHNILVVDTKIITELKKSPESND